MEQVGDGLAGNPGVVGLAEPVSGRGDDVGVEWSVHRGHIFTQTLLASV